MDPFTYQLAAIEKAAQHVIHNMRERRIIAFYGEMGVGKTTLIKAIAHLLGVKENVSSPTFALVNQYEGTLEKTIYHFDFYRIERIEEVYDMGYEEYFFDGALCLIEWPQKIAELLPVDTLKIKIDFQADGNRQISFG